MTKIAVVVLNYNGRSYLEKFLPTLIQHSKDAEVIVADNASTDDSLALLTEKFNSTRCIELDKNYGFAGGYNEALRQIESEYYVLVNSDVEVSDGWLQPLIGFLEQNITYSACQPKILDFNRKDHFEYAGASGGFIDSLGYPFCRGRVFETLEKDEGQYDDEIDILWSSGACFAIRSKVYHELEGFDADFFAHMEEIDLCWRMINSGYKIKCIPSSVVYHVGGGTLSKSSPFKTYLNFRNGLFLILKNMSWASLLFKLPIRILLDWVAAFKFAFVEGPNHSWSILKAHFHVVVRLTTILNKRSKGKKYKTESYSIVYKYFVRGEKKYNQL